MATRNICPRANEEGGIGTSLKKWLNGYIKNIYATTITATTLDTPQVTTWNAKQDALVSGTSIKTINSTSLLGSGNIDAGDVFATGSDGQLSRQMLKDCGYTFLDKGNSSTTDDVNAIEI